MKLRMRKVTAVLLLVFLLVTILGSAFYQIAFAQSAQQAAEEARKEKQEAQQKLDENQEQQSNLLDYKGQLDSTINSLHLELETLEETIVSTQSELDKLESDLEQAQNRVDIQDDLMKKRIRVMYEDGALGYLDVLLSAKSFSDLLSRIEAIRTITEYDANLLNRYEKAKKTVEDNKILVEQHKKSLEEARDSKLNKQDELQEQITLAQAEIDRLSAEESSLQEALAAARAAEEIANQRIAAAMAASGGYVDTSGDVYVPVNAGTFIWPFDQMYPITSGFVNRISPIWGTAELHTGLDIGAPYGTTIRAAAAGRVLVSEFNTGGYGNYVVIDHGGGYTTLYGHASLNLVQAGQTVAQGQAISQVGSTGWSTGPHLHFEIRVNNSPIDPSPYVLN